MLESKNLTVNDVSNFEASWIEKKKAQRMKTVKNIASIASNRLNKGMPKLQSNIAILYAERPKLGKQPCNEDVVIDTNIDSAFNVYKIRFEVPGPVDG